LLRAVREYQQRSGLARQGSQRERVSRFVQEGGVLARSRNGIGVG
jgi:hypothetical protein